MMKITHSEQMGIGKWEGIAGKPTSVHLVILVYLLREPNPQSRNLTHIWHLQNKSRYLKIA